MAGAEEGLDLSAGHSPPMIDDRCPTSHAVRRTGGPVDLVLSTLTHALLAKGCYALERQVLES